MIVYWNTNNIVTLMHIIPAVWCSLKFCCICDIILVVSIGNVARQGKNIKYTHNF